MEKTSKLLSILLLSILAISCDPGQELTLINKSDADVTVRFIEDGNSIHSIKNNFYFDYDISVSDTTLITLGQANGNDTTIYFGLGTWEMDNRLDSFLVNLKEVALLREKNTVVINNKKKMDELFRKNMSGKYQQSIIIRIDENGF